MQKMVEPKGEASGHAFFSRDQKSMVESLQKGDEVATSGGELGRVTKITGSYVMLEVSQNVEVIMQKTAIQTLLPKGTLKTIGKE